MIGIIFIKTLQKLYGRSIPLNWVDNLHHNTQKFCSFFVVVVDIAESSFCQSLRILSQFLSTFGLQRWPLVTSYEFEV